MSTSETRGGKRKSMSWAVERAPSERFLFLSQVPVAGVVVLRSHLENHTLSALVRRSTVFAMTNAPRREVLCRRRSLARHTTHTRTHAGTHSRTATLQPVSTRSAEQTRSAVPSRQPTQAGRVEHLTHIYKNPMPRRRQTLRPTD